jgi:hypothetical protein
MWQSARSAVAYFIIQALTVSVLPARMEPCLPSWPEAGRRIQGATCTCCLKLSVCSQLLVHTNLTIILLSAALNDQDR